MGTPKEVETYPQIQSNHFQGNNFRGPYLPSVEEFDILSGVQVSPKKDRALTKRISGLKRVKNALTQNQVLGALLLTVSVGKDPLPGIKGVYNYLLFPLPTAQLTGIGTVRVLSIDQEYLLAIYFIFELKYLILYNIVQKM